jgi:hypothetical protein
VAQFAVFDTFALPEKLTSSSLIISGAGLLSILAQIMMSKRRDIASLTLCSDSVVCSKGVDRLKLCAADSEWCDCAGQTE